MKHIKHLLWCLLILSSCVSVEKNITVDLASRWGSGGTDICSTPSYTVVPVNINYITTSEQTLKDVLNADTDVKGLPGL